MEGAIASDVPEDLELRSVNPPGLQTLVMDGGSIVLNYHFQMIDSRFRQLI